MNKYCWTAIVVLFLLLCIRSFADSSPWGANYFPNVPLITQDGKTVNFFDDLIKHKIVAINFIYTSCPDTCPLETAQLVKVQNILGDRLGKDIFFYSISIDPKNDSAQVLKEYKEKFGARWTFLTGKKSDVIKLRKKLGLYIVEIQDGSNNHNVNMIIGNQKTGRWMKRSPFENPYVLADQLGNWLTGWKASPVDRDYANAPELRNISNGEQLFRTRCVTCHSINSNPASTELGPDLLGVTQRREMTWLLNWLKAPDQMLKEKDPIAMELYKQYNNLAMPNMRLNQQEAMDLIAYINEKSRQVLKEEKTMDPEFRVSKVKSSGDVLAIMNAWVREATPSSQVNAGYMTLVNDDAKEVTLVNIESDMFRQIELHEMATVDGLMTMREVTDLVIPANSKVYLSPGGKHLMLKKPQQRLTVGQEVDMTLTFKSGIKQIISMKIATR